MKREEYQPGPAGEVAALPEGNHWILVFVRELRHPPQKVWNALTHPKELGEWAPFDADRDLAKTGDATLFMSGGTGEPQKIPIAVRHADAPKLLEYTWGPSVLRWELEPMGTGTRLTLRQTIDDRAWIPKTAAGWHICLDVADLFLSGRPIGRLVAEESRKHGWERLNAEYAARLGIENTGWPSESERGERAERR